MCFGCLYLPVVHYCVCIVRAAYAVGVTNICVQRVEKTTVLVYSYYGFAKKRHKTRSNYVQYVKKSTLVARL